MTTDSARDDKRVSIVSERDELVSEVRVRAWIESFFKDTRWLPDRWASQSRWHADALIDDAVCHLKVWSVESPRHHPYLAILFTSAEDDRVRKLPGIPSTPAHLSAGRGAVGGERGTHRDPASDEDRLASRLRRARAMRELGDLEAQRSIWDATQSGMSQRKVGDLVGRSQPDVGRTIKKVDNDLTAVDVTPREIALRRLIGEYSDTEMMARLLTFNYTSGEAEASTVGGGYMPGTWDDVRALRDQSLISETEWQELFDAVIGRTEVPAEITLPESNP